MKKEKEKKMRRKVKFYLWIKEEPLLYWVFGIIRESLRNLFVSAAFDIYLKGENKII